MSHSPARLAVILTLLALVFPAAASALIFPTPESERLGLSVVPHDEALEKAVSDRKLVVIYFWTDWCSNCAVFSQEVLSNAGIVGALKKDFLLVSINSDDSRDLANKYRVRVVPTLLFLDNSGKPVSVLPGAVPRQIFSMVLDYMTSGSYVDLEFEDYFTRHASELGDEKEDGAVGASSEILSN
jgi:thioredoxin 1